MKAVKWSQRVMVWCLVWLTGLQPLLPAWAAGVTVASGNTTLEAAGNGVPVVNIATPDAAGLSHNRYNDFNVDNRGLILNNGTAQLTPSQLGGLLQNNPNLNGRAASAIINEVVSPNRSHLAGYLEVAGQAANVMVANPYGITCSGCGFINTPRITLTTGTPQFDAAGGLSGLDVRGGDILVDGAGLDASRSDYFALIARTATLQAGLNARDAQVVLGANRVGTDGRITPQAGSGATPVLALDTGALGGMYANRISLVSTEQGVGVNTAGLSARQGDIQLSANGRLQVGSAIAQGNITAQGGTLVVAGDQQAQGAVALRGEQGITLGASRTQAGQGLTLSSDGRITADRARLSAGVSDSGTVQPGYGLTLSGTALALGQSQLAGDRLSLTSTGAVSQLSGGAWQAGSGLTLKGDALSLDGDTGAQTLTVSGGSLSGAGRWQSTGDLSLGGLTTAQWDGTLLAGGTLSLDSASLSNRGTLAGGQVQLTTPVLDNRGTVSGRQVRLQAGQLGNSGTLSADEGLSIQAQTGLDNSGSLLSGGGLTIAAGQTVNRGVLSGGAVTLSGDSLWNGGVVQGRQSLGVNALTGFSQTADGVLTSGGTVTLSSGTLETAGGLSAQGLQLHTGLWRNQGTVNLGGDGQLTLEALDNSGILLSSGAWDITGGRLGNRGSLGGTRLSVTAASLDNSGTLLGAQALTIAAGQQQNSGLLNTDGLMTLSGTTLDNSGTVKAQGGLSAAFDGRIDNRANGQLLSVGRGEITTGVLSNQGVWQADNLMLTSGVLDNGGHILGVNNGTLQLSGAYTGLTGSELTSGGTLQLQADRLDSAGLLSGTDTTVKAGTLQNGGVLQGYNGLTLNALQLDNSGTTQAQQLDITTDGQLTNRGTLLGLTGLTLQSAGLNNVSGARLYSAGNLQLRTGTLTQEGELAALGNLKADIGGPFTLTHTLAAGDQLTLNVTGDLLQAGTLQGNGVTVSSTGTLTQQGRIVAGTGTSTLSAAAISQTASGSIQGGGPLSLRADGNITNRGFVGTAADLLLQAGGLIDNSSLLYGGGNLQLLSDALVNRFGNILAGNSLWIQRDAAGNASSSVLNSSGTIETQRGDITVHTSTLTNQREGLTVTESSSSVADMPSWAGGNEAQIPIGYFNNPEDYTITKDVSINDNGGTNGCGCSKVTTYSYALTEKVSNGIISVPVYQSSVNVTANGGEARFISGSDILISSGSLNNQASLIGAGRNILLSGSELNNSSYQSGSSKRILYYKFDIKNRKFSNGASDPGRLSQYFPFILVQDDGTEYTPGQSYNATIQAGGAITANFAQNISNTGLQPGSGGFMPAIATPTLSTANGAGSQNTPASPSLVAGRDPLSLAGNSDPSLNALQTALAQLGGPSLNDYPLPTSQNGLFVADTSGNGRYLIRSNPRLSQLGQVDNGLFGDLRRLLGQTPGTSVPVETNPTLTDPTQFLGSSYLLGKLNLDAEHDYRFLGDAAFDTRYISNAVLSQTGQRYLNGVGSDLAQMQTLMDNAAAEKNRLNLQLGVSLSPEQVAGLSHSIVWWENITVDGQTVLAPKLYLTQADKTNLSGSRIVANSVSLSAGGDIDNRGSTVTALNALTVTSGGQVTNREGGLLNAGGALNLVALGNLTNSSATLQGNTVTLASVNGDIVNTTTTNQWHTQARDGRGSGSLTRTDIGQTGLITAQGGLTLQAGHDIALNGAQLSAGGPLALAAGNDIQLNVLGTVTETVRQDGRATTQRRQQGLVQSTLASGGGLSLSAGRDLNGTAAQLSATGTMALSAGRDLTLLSAEQEQFSSNAWNRHLDWQQTVTQQGTVLNAGDGLSLRAGRDLTLQGAQAETRGALTAQAGRDLNLLSATESQHDFFEETTVKKGFLSSTTTHTLREQEQTTEKGTLLSAGSVALTAGHDIGVRGSSVAADGDVALTAGHTINTAASVETYRQYEDVSRKKSGVFSGGGIGFTIGSTSLRQTLASAGTTESQSVSTLGSTGGSVSLRAGQDVNLSATDVIAARDIQVVGNTVTIDPGYDSHRQSQKMEQKTAGLTVTLSGVVGSALNSAVQAVQAVREQSDSRLQALQGMKAALSGYQAYQGTQVDTNNQGSSSFVGISVSLGAQRASSSQSSEQSQSFASTLNAGHDISVVARQGDITAVGSQLKAANNVDLNAAHAINLLSARNTESLTGSNSSSGGNIGVSFGLSNSGAGFSVFANVNAAKGREMGSGNSWSETTVDAGQRVGLTSGGDTRLIGAQVSGDRIVADVGGDLLLASQQDNNRYDSRQTSVSAGGSFTFGSMTGSGYLSASQDKMHSSYDSVQQQTGLFAGQGGYDIHVGNHTQLDGAVIGSTASADKNRLDTGTLGWSNIDNQAVFSVSHSGIGLSASPSLSLSDMMKSAALTAPSALMSMGRGGNASSTTYAAVSDGALIIRNQAGQQQDIATLSRDVAHANNALSPIFDKEKEQKRLQTAQMVGELGSQVMDVIRTEGEIRATRAAEASGKVDRLPDNASEAAWDKYRKDLTETSEYKAVMASYGTGSDLQRAAQAATATIQSLAGGGNLQQALAGASAPYLAQLVKSVTMPADERKATASDIAANAMGHALMGAVVAQLSGKDAVAGAVGAAGGELTARLLIMKELYGGRDTSDLTEAEKQSVSALASLAAGLASGIASGSVEGAATGAQAGRNAVENNYLSSTEKSLQTYLNHKENLTEQEKQKRDALNRKDLESDLAAIKVCQVGGSDCQAERNKALEALNTYTNLSYLNPKEAQAGYQQIQSLLNSTDPLAKDAFNVLEGYTQALMRFGYTEEEARARAGVYIGGMYLYGGISAIVASKELVKQFGEDIAVGNKSLAAGAANSLVKNADGIYEVKMDSTPLEGHERLNTPDLLGNGKYNPAEAAAAARLETVLGRLDRITDTPSTGKNADFIVTSGPNAGKTVDLMYTTKNLSQKEIDGINKFYEKNMTTPKALGEIPAGQDQILQHLNKADLVPVDFSVLTPSNQKIFMDYIKTLPKSQQDKIIIMR
ncbi:hemagglutinin repeat-containing protein [Dickeya zeae]|uniref:hemagglutinin repeat-containing protein n=1 Tax=Dickeya zeae TaxID=204042 RepID=UPI001CFABA15|nr:hemagglutinin repeat-containing protein [Dickeya zeae]UCZ75072.1 hemagglutinin repeat-containing protein [Dickeya zeae]